MRRRLQQKGGVNTGSGAPAAAAATAAALPGMCTILQLQFSTM